MRLFDAIGAVLFVAIIIAWVRMPQLGKPRHLPTPSCYIGHLLSMENRRSPEGTTALHFAGYMEAKLEIEDSFEITIPAWPDQEPHVLMCIRIAPGDSADLALK